MTFVKGHRVNIGRKQTPEHIAKAKLFHLNNRINKICQQCQKEFKAIPSHKNRKFCDANCWNLGKKGRTPWNKGKSHLKGMPKPWISTVMKGNRYAWKGGYQRQERGDAGYHHWRKIVLFRDNFKCRMLNDLCNGKLIAHHILPWREFKEERYNPNNGIALCDFHHPRKWDKEKEMIPLFQELIKRF